MTLQDLLKLLPSAPRDAGDARVLGVTEDSRRVKPGMVFVATPGDRHDGHEFAGKAVEAGAIAVLGNKAGLTEWNGVPYVQVEHPRWSLGVVAHALAGNPSCHLTVIGVTGTNGKSSTVLMIQRILQFAGYGAACFGTLGYDIAGEHIPAPHTTPFGEDLAAMLQRAREAGESHVVMEVSSHSLEQERVAGIHFTVGAFTNLTQDHLDFHKDMESYRRAKLRLFERIEGEGCFTVVNQEDLSATAFIEASRVPCHTYGAGGGCRADGVSMDGRRTAFTVRTPWGDAACTMRLLGHHNVSNALCAVAVCGGLGIPVPRVAEGLASLERVRGRFEHVENDHGFQVVIDYAHTDDGLRNVLKAARGICKGKVIVVFGCGGDRDKGKRPKMGAVAAELADYAFVTSDNPRTEDPDRIILDIEVGLQHAGQRKYDDYQLITDRTEAIRAAVRMAKPSDLVLIAGKGHEDYQILGTTRIHYDDREVAQQILEEI